MADKNIFCIDHIEEYIALFCTQCEDFICISCVAGNHNGHKMSKLSTLDNFLDKALTTDMKEDLDNLQTRLSTLKTEVDEKISSQSDDIVNIQCRIKDNTTLLQATLKDNEADLLASLLEHTRSLDNIKKKILFWENMMSSDQENDKSASTCNGIESEKLVQIKQNMAVKEFRNMSQTVRELPTSQDFKYQPSQFVTGKLINSEHMETQENNGTTIKVDFFKQCLSSHAQLNTKSEDFDCSSDEVRNKLHKIISLPVFDKNIKKIIPISDDKTWMQFEKSLYMINEKENLLLKCENDVDDLSMFSDGSLLILNKSNAYIKRRLHSGKLINYTSVQPYNPLWLDINSKDQVVVLVTETKKSPSIDKKNRVLHTTFETFHLVLFCNKGIKTREIMCIRLPTSITHISGIKLTTSNSLFFENPTTVICRNLETMNDQTFTGLFGMTPSKDFVTNGIAKGPDDSVMVIDRKHPAIFVLDKNLKYQNIVLDATNNIEEPSFVASYNNKLWVIDGNRILIFNYYPE